MFGFSRKKECYGIQILDSQIRFVEVSSTSKATRMLYHHTIPLSAGAVKSGKIADEDAVIRAIESIVRQSGSGGAQVQLSVPTSSIVMRKASFPRLKDKELRNLIDVELHGGSQLPFKDPVFDFVQLDSANSSKETEVLIFATPSELVDSYVHVVKKAGLDPVAVEIAPLAVYRLLLLYTEITGESLPERFMLLNMESDQVEFSMFAEGIPVFLRSMPLNRNLILAAENDEAGAYGRNLITELSRMVQYFKYNVSAEQNDLQALFLLGEDELVQDMPERLREVFTGSIRPVPLDLLLADKHDFIQSYAVPIGLALKGA